MKLRSTPALLILSLAAACTRGEGSDVKGPYAKDVAAAIPVIEKGTGLQFKEQPKVETRTKQQVRSFLEQRFADEVTDDEIEGQQIMYGRLGLIPDTMNLRKFMLDLLTEQVAGFYDPKTKVLYIVDGAPPEQVGFVVSHELVHALQDQYTNLDSIQDAKGDNDRSMAAQAVFEGQAMLVPLKAALGPGAFFPGGWDRVRDMIRKEQASMPIFNSAPFALQETLLFPYLSGADFIRRFKGNRGRTANPLEDLPVSSEQVRPIGLRRGTGRSSRENNAYTLGHAPPHRRLHHPSHHPFPPRHCETSYGSDAHAFIAAESCDAVAARTRRSSPGRAGLLRRRSVLRWRAVLRLAA